MSYSKCSFKKFHFILNIKLISYSNNVINNIYLFRTPCKYIKNTVQSNYIY